jgi:DNA-binding transcriptional regulator YiaG
VEAFMTLRPEYSLGHSEYNAFLFAAVGEEAVGLPLTVLTALTRLGIDPWQEAARLSDLPRETAAQVFALTIAELPEGDWKAADAAKIAARLVDSLPLRSAPPIPSTAVQRARGRIAMKNSSFPAWLAWSAVFVAALVLTLYLQPDRNLESPQGRETTTQR